MCEIEIERLKDLHAEILAEQEFALREEIKSLNEQWKIKYAQAMDTWAAGNVDRDILEDSMKRVIRKYAEEKDNSGDWRERDRILAVIGETFDNKPI